MVIIHNDIIISHFQFFISSFPIPTFITTRIMKATLMLVGWTMSLLVFMFSKCYNVLNHDQCAVYMYLHVRVSTHMQTQT